MTTLFEVKEKNEKIAKSFYTTPGAISPGAAFAVLSRHVLASLPDSLARRENLLRALVAFSPAAGRPSRRLGRPLPTQPRLASTHPKPDAPTRRP